ncbi:MAG: aryl-sulfate sulfotransferase [Chthoniobacterales bacterium]
MRKCLVLFAVLSSLLFSAPARATLADDTTITIEGDTVGPTAFIHQLTLGVSNTSALASVKFTITPKPGSVTRPLSGAYSNGYLTGRGLLQGGQIFLPVYGLYASYTNTVTLNYSFTDGSSKNVNTTIATDTFDDPCGYDKPTILQARRTLTTLSYDYILIRGSCSDFSPAVIDTDGALRWVGPGGFTSAHVNFFDNAFYIGRGTSLYRIDLDGTVTFLHDYSDIGVTSFHHNIDRGKTGLVLDVNTAEHKESLNLEVDAAGNVLKMWDMVDIISDALIAGGDNPDDFVVPTSDDWFHNNATAYNRADDSLVLSSRENFVIAIDYETGAIKWILGDPTKKWHEFPSLAKYALDLGPDTLPPVGQHAVSITYDQHVMVFDNGKDSDIQIPVGVMRDYASPRKYRIDLEANLATEVWNYERNQSVRSGICSGVYEDQPLNYLIDYADVNGPGAPVQYAQFLGLDANGEKIFHYQYDDVFCITAFNVLPLHLEDTAFPTVGPQALNLSTRGLVGQANDALIGGLIVTGSGTKKVALRALGPSLASGGLTDVVADPVLAVYDAGSQLVTMNDNWQTDPRAAELTTLGLSPNDPLEAAVVTDLTPGAYTVVMNGKKPASAIGLVEAYDLSPNSSSQLANLSTRGEVGTSDNVLISGFIVGDVASSTVVLRALGPSLSSFGVAEPLADPSLTVFDANGATIATNDNWLDDLSATDLTTLKLAPTDSAESATALRLPAGAYTVIVQGAQNQTGTSLVEIYELP